jgi:outer membrane protein TolC
MLSLGIVPPVSAQTPTVLTLEATIRRAQVESPSARIARLRREQAQWGYRSYQSDYLPSLSFSASGPGLERSISDIQQDDGSIRYVEQSRTLARAGLSIAQNIPLTGGSLSLSSGLSHINQFGEFDFSQWQSSPLVVGLSQPILQFNALKWNRRIRPIQRQVDEQLFLEEMAGVAFEITGLFFDVVIAQMEVGNATFNIAVNDTIYSLSRGRYDIGAIAENDLLQSELALLNAQVSEAAARVDLERALQNLRTALGLDVDALIVVDPPADIPDDEIDPLIAVAQAEQHQSAYRGFELESIEAQRAVAQAKRENGFSANLTAQVGFNQSATEFDLAYQNLLNSQRLSVNLQVPIVQWGRGKAEVQQAVAGMRWIEESQRLARRTLSQDVYFEAVRFVQLRDQVAIAAKADTVATRRFEVARNRYTIGRIDVTNLFDAQTEKDAARTAYTQTLRECWMSYYRLRQLTLYDFGNGVPLVY